MKYHFLSIRYLWLTFRREQVWLPNFITALFMLVIWLLRDPVKGADIARGFLGVTLPLIGGILAAYAVLDDPALEIQFSCPRPAWMALTERLAPILFILAECALVFQAFLAIGNVSLDIIGNPAYRQLAWIIPSLAMTGLGSASSFLLKQTSGGAVMVGMVWIVQLIARSWFIGRPVARYLFLFGHSLFPEVPFLPGMQVSISLAGLMLLAAAWMLFRKQENYI